LAGLFLDTTVLIDALRGRRAAERLRALRGAGPPPYVCAINVEEVWRGTRRNEEDAVRALLGALRIAPLSAGEGERAGRWRSEFAARGISLSQGDCLVAAAAVSVGARLATGNPTDFPMLEDDLEHWPTGD
jgi:predicted nucleic acid-binding protein